MLCSRITGISVGTQNSLAIYAVLDNCIKKAEPPSDNWVKGIRIAHIYPSTFQFQFATRADKSAKSTIMQHIVKKHSLNLVEYYFTPPPFFFFLSNHIQIIVQERKWNNSAQMLIMKHQSKKKKRKKKRQCFPVHAGISMLYFSFTNAVFKRMQSI